MTTNDALLLSWRRQCLCIRNLAALVRPELMEAKPSPEGWNIADHLCHLQDVRSGWLRKVTGAEYPELVLLYDQVGDDWFPSLDFPLISGQLTLSENALHDWLAQALANGDTEAGPYEHPVMFLQHMVWHEGYHFALIMLALRIAGVEPSDEWEEENIWGNWRDPNKKRS